jgi:HPt (histidine-containing phosphotransfer) domain-containing protein
LQQLAGISRELETLLRAGQPHPRLDGLIESFQQQHEATVDALGKALSAIEERDGNVT